MRLIGYEGVELLEWRSPETLRYAPRQSSLCGIPEIEPEIAVTGGDEHVKRA